MMIDYLKTRTFNQAEITRLRGLNLTPDYPIQGWECFRLTDRIKMRFRPLHSNGEFIGYSFADITLQPHFIYNDGIHNGNDFSPYECVQTLNRIFNELGIQDLTDFQVVNIEFGVNVIPETDVKEVINSIKYWKRKPYKRNKADFSLITDSTTHKQIKAYAKGLDAVERLKTDEVHLNTFRFEARIKKQQQIKFSIWKSKAIERRFTAIELLNPSTYLRFQELLLQDFRLSLFIDKPKNKKGLSGKEKKDLKELVNPDSWTAYLTNLNRDKFNYQRKKYEKIMAKIPNIKTEIEALIEAKFKEWENSAILPNNNLRSQTDICHSFNELEHKPNELNSVILPSRAFYRVETQTK